MWWQLTYQRLPVWQLVCQQVGAGVWVHIGMPTNNPAQLCHVFWSYTVLSCFSFWCVCVCWEGSYAVQNTLHQMVNRSLLKLQVYVRWFLYQIYKSTVTGELDRDWFEAARFLNLSPHFGNVKICICWLLGTLQHPGIWHKCNAVGGCTVV